MEADPKEFDVKKNIAIALISAAVLLAVFAEGCRQAPETAPDRFATTYSLIDEDRSFSISGASNAEPGERSQYVLEMNNQSSTEAWRDEYYVLLVGSEKVIQEITHEEFDIPAGSTTQDSILIEFPNDYRGVLGLCVLIPKRASVIATLSTGAENSTGTGWPDINSYPFSLNIEGG